MMTKVSYMMQDNIRRSYSLITDVQTPNTFFVRGRLPFPQGLLAMGLLLHGKYPADLYAHRYFIEKQSMPSQPSPQLQLTEELQGLFKVLGGLVYRNDESAKLDNTMTFSSDFRIVAVGRMIRVDEFDGEAARRKLNTGYSKLREGMPSAELHRLSMRHVHINPDSAIPGEDGGGGKRNGKRLGAKDGDAAPLREGFPLAAASMDRSNNWRYFAETLSVKVISPELHNRAALPETEEELFTRAVGGYTVLFNPIAVNDKTFQELILKLRREMKVVKTIVVPTRQAWRHVQIWADAFPDAEIISSCPIPRFDGRGTPTATIAGLPQQDAAYKVMESGATGIEFPDIPEDVVINEKKKAVEDNGTETVASGSPSSVASAATTTSTATARRSVDEEAAVREELRNRSRKQRQGTLEIKLQQRKEGAKPAVAVPVNASQEMYFRELGSDEVDQLWLSKTQFAEKLRSDVQRDDNQQAGTSAGLRASEFEPGSGRTLRVLEAEGFPSVVVTQSPRITLHYIPGDRTSEEYVLYDAHSGCLSCTELYHGTYADFDPASTWLSRVWFKFMKRGDYKRDDLVPRDKYLQVLRQGTWNVVREAVDRLTRGVPLVSPESDEKSSSSAQGQRKGRIRLLVYAHGTSPQADDPANRIRNQWNLPPITIEEEGGGEEPAALAEMRAILEEGMVEEPGDSNAVGGYSFDVFAGRTVRGDDRKVAKKGEGEGKATETDFPKQHENLQTLSHKDWQNMMNR